MFDYIYKIGLYITYFPIFKTLKILNLKISPVQHKKFLMFSILIVRGRIAIYDKI